VRLIKERPKKKVMKNEIKIAVVEGAGDRVKWKLTTRMADHKYLGEKSKKKKEEEEEDFEYEFDILMSGCLFRLEFLSDYIFWQKIFKC